MSGLGAQCQAQIFVGKNLFSQEQEVEQGNESLYGWSTPQGLPVQQISLSPMPAISLKIRPEEKCATSGRPPLMKFFDLSKLNVGPYVVNFTFDFSPSGGFFCMVRPYERSYMNGIL